ncbi:MAG TPA: hypothetical protein VMH05_14040 [Bryobacteraceae bacterium]|nr:hypothetical protein [Bryobacteraceae bacterium]
MNWKIVAAFAAGAVLASGIVYLTVRPMSLPQAQSIADVRPASEPPAAPAPSVPAPETSAPTPEAPHESPVAPPAETAPKPAPQHPRLSHTPIREKPSPMPPVVHREKLPVVARNQETIPAPAPAPVPAAAPEPLPPAPPQPPPVPEPAPTPPVVAKVAPEPEGRVPHTVVLAAGTPLVVRIGETVSAAHNQVGDTFFATLEQQLVIDGFIIGERGARVVGRVTQAVPSGRGGGVSHLAVELERLSTSDGQRVTIRTDPYVKQGSGSTGGDLAKIGAGAVIGAAIGAVAGGGKGAAIGAGAGAAAGTGAVLITNGKSVEIPVETRLTFRVKDSIRLTEKLD